MFNSPSGRAIRFLRIFLPKSVRAKLGRLVRKAEWLFEQNGLQSDISKLEQHFSSVGARLSAFEELLPAQAAELRNLSVSQQNMNSRLTAQLAELVATIAAQTVELRTLVESKQRLEIDLGARQQDLESRLSGQLAEIAAGIAVQRAELGAIAESGQRLENDLGARQQDIESRLSGQLAEIAAAVAVQRAELGAITESGQRLENDLGVRTRDLVVRQDGLDSRLTAQFAELAASVAAQTAELGAGLAERTAELHQEMESRLARRESELRVIRSDLKILDAHLAFVRQPDELSVARWLQAKLNEYEKELPDDIQEKILRLELHREPYDLKLTRSLIAVRYGKLGRPPLPETPVVMARDVAAPDGDGIDELLVAAKEHARTGDIFSLCAVLWQVVIRDPGSARGWAEFARHLADRGDFGNAHTAVAHALKAANTSDLAASSLLAALSRLADEDQLKDVNWKTWMQQLKPALHKRPQVLNLLVHMDDIEAAKKLLPQVTRKWPKNATTWLTASKVAYEEEDLSRSYTYLRRALELDVPLTLHEIVRTAGAATSQIVRKLNKCDEIADWISQASASYPEINLLPAHPSTEALIASRQMRSEALERGLPSALLITQAKTASVSIGNIFSSGFSLPTVLYSFLDVRIVAPWLKDFLRGGSCYTTHLLPSLQNIDLLARGGVRSVIVNVRDPRQVMISTIEHARRYPRQIPPSARRKLDGGGSETIQWAIEYLLPETVGWIEGWIRARDKLTVNFTTFEEFVADKDKFLDKIIAFYGGDPRYLRRESVFTEYGGIDYHRRRGEVDEWRRRVTPQQAKRITRAMPDHFWELFDWQP